MDANLSPCKGKSFKNQGFIKLLPLQGALLIAIIPRALPWARSFWAFSPFLNHMRKFCCLNKSLYIFYWKVCTFGNLLLCEPHAEKTSSYSRSSCLKPKSVSKLIYRSSDNLIICSFYRILLAKIRLFIISPKFFGINLSFWCNFWQISKMFFEKIRYLYHFRRYCERFCKIISTFVAK